MVFGPDPPFIYTTIMKFLQKDIDKFKKMSDKRKCKKDSFRSDQLDFLFCEPARMVVFSQTELKISPKKIFIRS